MILELDGDVQELKTRSEGIKGEEAKEGVVKCGLVVQAQFRTETRIVGHNT